MKIVLLRGLSSTGKTTLAKNLGLELKKNKFKPAIINEDNYRKSLQFKYKAIEQKVHLNSVKIILSVMKTLRQIDTYDYIILEGLFRYEKQVKEYLNYFKKNNDTVYLYHINASDSVRKEFNEKRERHKADLDSDHSNNLERKPLKNFKKITSKDVKIIIKDLF